MTQHEQILTYIRTFGSISPMEAFADLGITKLATRVSEMRKEGISFIKEPITTKNRFGKSVIFMRYKLDDEQQTQRS